MSKKRKHNGLYLAGGLALAIGTFMVMPKVIDFWENKVASDLKSKVDEDDWGPEIVRKEKTDKEEKDGEL